MKQPKGQRFNLSIPIALMLFLLILSLPMTVLATSYLYTYTGNPFTIPPQITGTEWTTSDYMTVTFTLDPGLGSGSLYEYSHFGNITVPYTVSVGTDTVVVPTGSSTNGNLLSLTWNAEGSITTWLIEADTTHIDTTGGFQLVTEDYDSEIYDFAYLLSNPSTILAFAGNSDHPGEWTMTIVPEPMTLLLLAPGLAGLWVWARRKFKCI
jgi:hypothetical protein